MSTYVPAMPMQSRATALLRYWPMLLLIALVAAFAFFPELAMAQDAKAKVAANAKKSYELVFEWAYYICAAIIVLTGLGAMTGRMEWKTFGFVALGVGIIFSGTAIVDYFR